MPSATASASSSVAPIDAIPSSKNGYAAVVVGAGPAGLTVVGNLIERRVGRILWVDKQHFNGGRLNSAYREVSSNTRVSLFLAFGEAVEPFRKVIEATPRPNAVSKLKELPQDRPCPLEYACDMCLMLTEGLANSEDVDCVTGEVTFADLDDSLSLPWKVQIQPAPHSSSQPTTVFANRLILCTGSSPAGLDLSVRAARIAPVHLDIALKPSLLVSALASAEPSTVAVLGTSHSAVTVLIHLYQLASTTHPRLRALWFARNPLRYAEYMDGWILYDNTGLKGAAADFARNNLEDDKLPSSPVSKFITKIDASRSKFGDLSAYETHLPGCTHIIQAVGFMRDPIPHLSRNGQSMAAVYGPTTAGFTNEEGEKIPGLYGAGIAWPERVVDPAGNCESAVGMFKFMKYIKRVVGDWEDA